MQNGTETGAATEYHEAMLRGAGLAWEELWEAAATAYRRALATRPGDPAAEQQLAFALRRAAGASAPLAPSGPKPAPMLTSIPPHSLDPVGDASTSGMRNALFGRTASAHVAELAELPRDLVRTVVERMRAIEHDQAAGRFNAAFESAYALLEMTPTFLPLHILLAELYADTGQWQAVHQKLEAVEAAYAARRMAATSQAAA